MEGGEEPWILANLAKIITFQKCFFDGKIVKQNSGKRLKGRLDLQKASKD
jgi:hypothetical protein